MIPDIKYHSIPGCFSRYLPVLSAAEIMDYESHRPLVLSNISLIVKRLTKH